jgi:hypothetical protein
MDIYTTTPRRVNALSLYRARPAVAAMVLQAIIESGGAIPYRWPAPCPGKFPRWTIPSGGGGR